ncbi:hypothetical protein D5R40_23405 [Okeania hirsuta]|uniref:Uncharacterized protein n=1 Tax=Okeania hirsuta TaxID=1458930 RepID=A0A3N6RHQ4_9CYAN|nr:hypothetical protein D4Z78_05370 [Okeania hirsuta]RQH31165.1 hypothetical protein D5R40_23405 [Okeania hirsuta]
MLETFREKEIENMEIGKKKKRIYQDLRTDTKSSEGAIRSFAERKCHLLRITIVNAPTYGVFKVKHA